jgi:NDP-sugar pyrophosphorylase family protein
MPAEESASPGGERPPVLILAAGKGTRLGELGRRSPKVLVPVQGRPLLDLHLNHLAAQGVQHVVINACHLAPQIVDHVSAYQGALDVEVIVEPELLGTAGGAINALPRLGALTFIVLYGDVMLFEPLEPLLAAHASSRALATLSVYEHTTTHGKGVVEVDEQDRITGFAEKDPARQGPGLVNAGLYVISASLLDGHPRGVELDFGRDVFPAAVQHGAHLQAYRLPQPVLDIGTPQDLERALAGET